MHHVTSSARRALSAEPRRVLSEAPLRSTPHLPPRALTHRDRITPAAPTSSGQLPLPVPPSQQPYLEEGQGAVSYTHLTLPTICSV
eukprot:2537817-Rhodomonas_salina.1